MAFILDMPLLATICRISEENLLGIAKQRAQSKEKESPGHRTRSQLLVFHLTMNLACILRLVRIQKLEIRVFKMKPVDASGISN